MFIIAPEQIIADPTQMPRFGRAIRKNKAFNRSISHVYVDEAHVIASAGVPGASSEDPFRPAYGGLDKFRPLLSHSTSVSALTATATPYVEALIKIKLALRPNLVKIIGPLNRPDLTYATLDIVDSPSNFKNVEFLVPPKYQPGDALEPTLIFFDTQNMSREVARYLNVFFGPDHRGQSIVRHYHSGMSKEYLQQTYDSFASDTGSCMIFCATKGASTVCILLLN